MSDGAPLDVIRGRDACEACGGGDLTAMLEVEDKTGLRYEMVRCRRCNLMQVSQIISQGQAGRANWEGLYYGRAPTTRDPDPERRNRALLEKLRRWGIADGKLLDVGCSFGHLLFAAAEMGYDVYGVDHSDLCRQHLQQHGFAVFPSLGQAVAKAPFDVVTCCETIYYMRQPAEDLRRIHDLLRPGGCLLVKSRANRTYIYRLARWCKGKVFHLPYGHPLQARTCGGFYSFSTSNLQCLLERSGFQMLTVCSGNAPIHLSLNPRKLVLGLGEMTLRLLSPVIRTVSLGRRDSFPGITVYAQRMLGRASLRPVRTA